MKKRAFLVLVEADPSVGNQVVAARLRVFLQRNSSDWWSHFTNQKTIVVRSFGYETASPRVASLRKKAASKKAKKAR